MIMIRDANSAPSCVSVVPAITAIICSGSCRHVGVHRWAAAGIGVITACARGARGISISISIGVGVGWDTTRALLVLVIVLGVQPVHFVLLSLFVLRLLLGVLCILLGLLFLGCLARWLSWSRWLS